MSPEKLSDIIDQFRSWSVIISYRGYLDSTQHLPLKLRGATSPYWRQSKATCMAVTIIWLKKNHHKANMYERDPSWAKDVTWSCWDPAFSSFWSSPCVPRGGRAVAGLRSGDKSWRRCSLSTRPRGRGGGSLLGRLSMLGLVQLTEISKYHCKTCPTPWYEKLYIPIFSPLWHTIILALREQSNVVEALGLCAATTAPT